MAEVQEISTLELYGFAKELAKLSIPTGKFKPVSFNDITGLPGVQFPGVFACTPAVLYSWGPEQALAMHIGAPGKTPEQIETAIRQHIDKYGSHNAWSLHAAMLTPTDEDAVKTLDGVEGRKENIEYLQYLEKQNPIPNLETQIQQINANFYETLSFRVPTGFMIVKYTH